MYAEQDLDDQQDQGQERGHRGQAGIWHRIALRARFDAQRAKDVLGRVNTI
jgi:hypothetical protein